MRAGPNAELDGGDGVGEVLGSDNVASVTRRRSRRNLACRKRLDRRPAGVFDHGKGERDDLRAVVDWVRAARPGEALWLAGFSFGSFVSLSSAAALRADALISIAPPVSGRGWDFSGIEIPAVPWLVVQGDADEIVDAQAVYDWVESLPRKPQLVRMVDTSHFFHRKLIDLRGAIQHEVKAWLPPA